MVITKTMPRKRKHGYIHIVADEFPVTTHWAESFRSIMENVSQSSTELVQEGANAKSKRSRWKSCGTVAQWVALPVLIAVCIVLSVIQTLKLNHLREEHTSLITKFEDFQEQSIEKYNQTLDKDVVLPTLNYEVEYMKTIKATQYNCQSLGECDHMRYSNITAWEEYSGLGKFHYTLWRLLKLQSLYNEKHKMEWHLVGGSLLGFMRHGKNVPHTDDADIVMQYKDRLHMVENGMLEFPKDIIIQDDWKLSDINTCIRFWGTWIHIDIWTLGDHWKTYNTYVPDWDWDKHSLPIEYISFWNLTVGIPNNIDKPIRDEYSDQATIYKPMSAFYFLNGKSYDTITKPCSERLANDIAGGTTPFRFDEDTGLYFRDDVLYRKLTD